MIDYETVWKLLDASLTSRQTMWQNYQTVYGVTFLRRAEESLTVTWRTLKTFNHRRVQSEEEEEEEQENC